MAGMADPHGGSWADPGVTSYTEQSGILVELPAEPIPPVPKPAQPRLRDGCADCALLGHVCGLHDPRRIWKGLPFARRQTRDERLERTFYPVTR
jgi:hypothetical protein